MPGQEAGAPQEKLKGKVVVRILSGEIETGVVPFLCNFCLRELSDCESNAWLQQPGNDHSIVEPHYFLIVGLIEVEDKWLAAPLSSHPSGNREKLHQSLKWGFKDQWSVSDSYFYKFQFWKLTTNAICRASNPDASLKGNRRFYGSNFPGDLAPLFYWNARNRNAFRVMMPK